MDNQEIVAQLEELLTGHESEDDAYTTRDLIKLTGRGEGWVNKAINQALDAGTWEVLRIKRRNRVGSIQMRYAYRPIKRTRKKK